MDDRQGRGEGPGWRPLIDPRIRQRRIEVRRGQGRRRLRALTWAMVGASVGLMAWAVVRSPLLDVDGLQVRGARQTAMADLARAADLRGRAMLDLDESAAARRIERLPWVGRAQVRRSWPATVQVDIVERLPVAKVALSALDMKMLVDGTGRVLGPAAAESDLPLLVGIGEVPRPGRSLDSRALPLVAVAGAVPGSLMGRLTGVAAGPDGRGVELRLRPSGVARLGGPEDIERKLAAVLAVLGQVDTNRMAMLDVRVPASPVLTRQAARQ